MLPRPPIPEPTKAPTRWAFASVISRPLSSRAIFAAARAKWMKRSLRRTSFLGIQSSGTKSEHSAANRVVNSVGSKWVMGPTPDVPAISASQVFRTPVPSGVTSPRPVTATLRRIGAPSQTSGGGPDAYFLWSLT